MEALVNATTAQASFTINANTTKAELTQLFRLMSAQFANMYLKNAVEHPITGINISRMARLKIYSLSFWRIESFLLFLTLATPFLDFMSPVIIPPRDPSIIVGLATVLSHSDMVVTSLKGTGRMSARGIGKRLWD